MTIQEAIQQVLPLQLKYNKTNTPDMQIRGSLIRDEIPNLFKSALTSKRIPNSNLIPDLFVEGSDGKGNKNYVPWVRFASQSLSPSARIGWYLTFLFSTDGSSVWLVLAHASTSEGGKKISREVRQKLRNWGLSKLPDSINIDDELKMDIDLKSTGSGLGEEFESTSLFGYEFNLSNIPSDQEIFNKIGVLIPHLNSLYSAELNDASMPSAEPIEIITATDVIDQIAGKIPKKRKSSGQGFGGSYAENRAIERRAVDLAVEYFRATKKWDSIKDTGATESFDLLLSNKDSKMYVEVKGTQSSGERVFLSKNEVNVQKQYYPNNALVIVSAIKLTKGEVPTATEGEIRVISPWMVEDSDLTAMAYEYSVPVKQN